MIPAHTVATAETVARVAARDVLEALAEQVADLPHAILCLATACTQCNRSESVHRGHEFSPDVCTCPRADVLDLINDHLRTMETNEMRDAALMSENPFAEKPPWKKRVITVSLTREQDEEFEALKARTRTVTDGAMIKKALAHFIDWMSDTGGKR